MDRHPSRSDYKGRRLRGPEGTPETSMTEAGHGTDPHVLQDDLLATKLFRPAPRCDLVHRVRLTGRLAAGLTAPLTVIVAPAGWGKTSLLAEWLAPRDGPVPAVAWLALDGGDNDVVRFLRYLIGALQTIDREIGGRALSYLLSGQPMAAEMILTALINDLAGLTDDVVLVLDDYHAIETPAIHEALTFLLDHLPPRLHLAIATRTDPPLSLARLRARGLLVELRAADLAFAGDEAMDFLNDVMRLQLSADEVLTLQSRTEGWIAGLHLAALTLRDRDPGHRRDFITSLSGTHRYILDYLAGEVFERQPPDVQRFLLYTSILGGLSGPLCDAVLGGPSGDGDGTDGQAMLERLDDANLFVVRLDDTRTWYRYHHLFAGFLRERLRRKQPDVIPELHRRAALWLEESGRPVYAAEHALSAEDYDEAARLLEQVIASIIWRRGEIMTLLHWLERLPRTATRKRPRLSLDLAWTLLWSAKIDAIEPRLQDAEQALADSSTPGARALRGEAAAIRAELARQRGEIDSAVAMARQALDDLPQDSSLVRSATSGLLGQAELVRGDAVSAGEAFADAAALSRPSDTFALTLIAQGRLLQTQVLQGRFGPAVATYRQSIALAEDSGIPDTPAIGVAQVYMAEILREWNDLAGAEDLVREGIRRCTEWPGLAEMALDGSITLARVLDARGDTQGAYETLEAAERSGRDARVFQCEERIALARAWLWIRNGDETEAMRWARDRRDAWQARGTPGYVGLQEQIMLARLSLSRGETDDALAVLHGRLETAESGGLTGCTIEILVLRALALHGRGQVAQAMPLLTRALALAEPEGYVRIFVDQGPQLVRVLRQARSRGVSPSYIDVLLRAADARVADDRDRQELVEPLSARELELLRLFASGLSTSEVAAQLFITTGTARNHLKNIYGKLDAHNRVQAIERARALNLL